MVLGGAGGLVTVAFLRTLGWVKDLVWSEVPGALGTDPAHWSYVVPAVLCGAVLLGLARRHLGEYPVPLDEAIDEHKRTGEFDHRHIGQAIVISLVSLGFGAALGPEAALMAVIGGLGSWVARVIDLDTSERREVPFVGVAAALGALFGGAGAAALTLDPRDSGLADARRGRLLRLVPGLVAAAAGLLVYRHLGVHERYFDLGIAGEPVAAVDLAWAMVAIAAGVAAGALFVSGSRVTERLTAGLRGRPVLQSVVGGLVLAALASWSGLVLFSGHEGVEALVHDDGGYTAGFLVLVAVAKLVAAALLLATGWKGGRFFPAMFAGAALGLALSQSLGGVSELVGVAAGMTAVVGLLLGRPVLTALFMVWFFPLDAWPVVVLAAVVAGLAGRVLTARLTSQAEPSNPSASP